MRSSSSQRLQPGLEIIFMMKYFLSLSADTRRDGYCMTDPPHKSQTLWGLYYEMSPYTGKTDIRNSSWSVRVSVLHRNISPHGAIHQICSPASSDGRGNLCFVCKWEEEMIIIVYHVINKTCVDPVTERIPPGVTWSWGRQEEGRKEGRMRCLLTTTHTCSSSLLVCLSDLIGKLQVRCRLWSDAICMQVRAASNCLYHHHHHDHHQSLLQMYLGHFLADCATSPLFLLCLMDGTLGQDRNHR